MCIYCNSKKNQKPLQHVNIIKYYKGTNLLSKIFINNDLRCNALAAYRASDSRSLALYHF